MDRNHRSPLGDLICIGSQLRGKREKWRAVNAPRATRRPGGHSDVILHSV
jgi:hypothetical protein